MDNDAFSLNPCDQCRNIRWKPWTLHRKQIGMVLPHQFHSSDDLRIRLLKNFLRLVRILASDKA